jgi:uroporphyrinogen III methyltransferase/synthase
VAEITTGTVYIIGAGPGDPELISIKGARCLGRADVVIYDYLVHPDVLNHARPGARLVYAGKQGGAHTLSQDAINNLIVAEARQGRTVARLKGGDPFIFGRGGEEADVLAREGIRFEVVPGVTSAIAVPAYAGIPLTHREHASTLAFVTGHEDPAKDESGVDWGSLAGIGTLVFLMGVKNLPKIAEGLIAHGKDRQTPVAVIRRGTTADQVTLTGTLQDIAGKAGAAGLQPPAIVVVGEVVRFRESLNWFETRPLFGRGVVVTRPEPQAEPFAALLREQGARVIPFPVIQIEPPRTWEAADQAIVRLGQYQWIIFTSANGVRCFSRRLTELGGDVRALKGLRLCTIGPATAEALAGLGLKEDLVPEKFVSEGVVEAFAKMDIKGTRMLLPRAEEARDVIPGGLAGQGADVDVIAVYRTAPSGRTRGELDAWIGKGLVDAVTFTSPSTVRHFLDIMGRQGADDLFCGRRARIAAIGPVTAEAVRQAGYAVDIFQETYTVAGMVEALAAYYARGVADGGGAR